MYADAISHLADDRTREHADRRRSSEYQTHFVRVQAPLAEQGGQEW
jgi:hypothetical protein